MCSSPAWSKAPSPTRRRPLQEKSTLYVGMTRARQQLTLLAHRQRPSAFVAQLGYAESTQAAKAPA